MASPVTVTILRISGMDSVTASPTETTVSTLSTTHPASAGSIVEFIFLPVVAKISCLSAPCGYFVFKTLTWILDSF